MHIPAQPFGVENCDLSKIVEKKRKALACPTEGVDIDNKTERSTQVEKGSMVDIDTNTDVCPKPVTRENLHVTYPFFL